MRNRDAPTDGDADTPVRRGLSRRLALPALALGMASTTSAAWVGHGRLRAMASRDGREPVSRSDAEADLAHLQHQLETRFSYLHRRGVDHRRALAELRERLPDPLTLLDLRIELSRFLARFDDGHAGLRGRVHLRHEGFLPVLVAETAGGIAAFAGSQQGLVDTRFPYLCALDGLPIERWMEAAGQFRGGSPQWRRRAALVGLSRVQVLRRELGLPAAETVKLELRDDHGTSRALELPLAPRPPAERPCPPNDNRILPGNVGYIRIAAMDPRPEVVAWLLQAMQSVRATDGLILDVRGNGGGSRLLLLLLFSFFMTEGDAPHIGNVAQHRLAPGDPPDAPDGYLAERFLYPRDASVYGADERAAIDRFAARFQPEWTPPAGSFSAWHYLLLTRRPALDGAYHYDRPLVVLIDGGAFSATDVFAGSFKGWRDVTLMGLPTGGGSGRARSFELPRTRLEGRFSTMASFQPSGLLYDGRGVEPDVTMPATADDWLGRTDTVLKAARDRLTG